MTILGDAMAKESLEELEFTGHIEGQMDNEAERFLPDKLMGTARDGKNKNYSELYGIGAHIFKGHLLIFNKSCECHILPAFLSLYLPEMSNEYF